MLRVLIVEDSKFLAGVVQRRIDSDTEFSAHAAHSFAEGRVLAEAFGDDLFAVVLDLNLPDAHEGEALDYFVDRAPVVVFTSTVDEEIRKSVLAKRVVDYVLKDHPDSLNLVVRELKRLAKNAGITALVVDDSRVARGQLRTLLKDRLFKVMEASNGAEALKMVRATSDIKLVITDYDMPVMNGMELVTELRKRRSMENLAIIALSASSEPTLCAQFLKTGSSDFLNKPFLAEEFHLRVTQNLEMIEHIELIWRMSNQDTLTGLFNRRYFFGNGAKLLNSSEQGCKAAMLDIDHFKLVNDRYGHAAGDRVLRAVAERINERFGEECLVGRLGGEEFAVLDRDLDPKDFTAKFEALCREVEGMVVEYEGQTIAVTVSIGLCVEQADTLDEMLVRADNALYKAKNSGRNRVVVSQ